MPERSVLEVLLHGRLAGTLALVPGEQTLFAFSQAYIDDPQRPTLSLSFHDPLGNLITEVRPTRMRVPPFFANLLPEGPLRDYLARRAGVNPRRDFFLLWALGRDLPGALVVRHADREQWPHDERGDDDDSKRHKALRFSLAGVQLKFSAVLQARGGLTIPAEGVGGSWIVKLPSAQFKGVPENEFSMMALARRVGIDVPDVRLVAIDDIEGLPEGIERIGPSALAVRRFDRAGDGGLIHAEDLAQVFGIFPEDKYERVSYRNIGELIWRTIGEEGIAEFVRRLVFNALIGNADMHLKNWSLIYPDGRSPALSPGYDFVSTMAYLPDDRLALGFMGSKRFEDLTTDQFKRFAAKARLPEKLTLDTVRRTVEAFHAVWKTERSDLPLERAAVEAIDRHVKRIPIAVANG